MTECSLITTLLPTLSALFRSPQIGFPVVMTAFAVAGTGLIWTTFAVTSERIGLDAPPPSLRQSLTALTRNGPLISAIAMFTLGMLAFTIRATVAPYYFKYNREQTATTLSGIVALLTLAPAAIMGVVLATSFFYRLDARSHARIVEELGARAEQGRG